MPRKRSSAVKKARSEWTGIAVFTPKELIAKIPEAQKFFASLQADSKPIELEIGCGTGDFILGAAAKFPGRTFLGVEYAKKFVRYVRDRIDTAQLQNIRMICADAGLFIDACLPNECLEAVHVYFPDPWPKKSQQKRRFMGEPGLQRVARVLKPDGKLYFASDYEQYAEAVREMLLKSPLFRVTRDLKVQSPDEFYAAHGGRTHFGQRYLKQGKPLWAIECKRST